MSEYIHIIRCKLAATTFKQSAPYRHLFGITHQISGEHFSTFFYLSFLCLISNLLSIHFLHRSVKIISNHVNYLPHHRCLQPYIPQSVETLLLYRTLHLPCNKNIKQVLKGNHETWKPQDTLETLEKRHKSQEITSLTVYLQIHTTLHKLNE